jgi:hypothetical protein
MLLTRGNRRLLKNQVLHFLITPQLKALQLNPFLEDDLKFFTALSKLQVFIATGLELKDHCLKVIGTYCKCLRYFLITIMFHISQKIYFVLPYLEY